MLEIPERLNFNDRTNMAMELPVFVIMAGELTSQLGNRLIFNPFNLSLPQYSLMAILSGRNEKLSMTELRESTYILNSPSNVTHLVDQLEARGLVSRSAQPDDRRVTLVEITDEGKKLIEEVNQRYYQVMMDLLEGRTLEELRESVMWHLHFIKLMADKLGIEKL